MKRILCYGLTLFLILRGSAQTATHSELATAGLSVAEKMYALKVYPNPADETLNIRCNVNIEYATVCDMAGHALIKAEGRISSLDIRTLPVGIYLLKLRSFDGHEMAVNFIRN